ncbi:MAG TPA: single-stranded DNA-binding protein [Oscillatoriaceae cyanobacterium]
MKILLTGSVQSFADKKGTVVLESVRKAKEAPITETFYLKFHSDDAYQDFKSRYKAGDGVQVIGLVRQVQTPIIDRVTKKTIQGTHGKDLRNTLLAVEVKEHKPHTRDEFDTLYAHGIVSVVKKEDLRQSGSGLPYLKLRVVFNHYKRPDEEEGQADFYNLVAFGGQAESLDGLDKGDRFVLDYGVIASSPYEMRDVAHSDGTAITRNGPELVLREFTYLPRANRQAQETVPAGAGEEIPF